MIWSKSCMTVDGAELVLLAQTGVEINITRMTVGDGLPNTPDAEQNRVNAMVNPYLDIDLISLKVYTQEPEDPDYDPDLAGWAQIKGAANNSGGSTARFVRELGVYANHPTKGEILYCYLTARERGDALLEQPQNPDEPEHYGDPGLLPAAPANIMLYEWNVLVLVSNAPNVTAVISNDAYARQAELDELRSMVIAIDARVTAMEAIHSIMPAVNKSPISPSNVAKIHTGWIDTGLMPGQIPIIGDNGKLHPSIGGGHDPLDYGWGGRISPNGTTFTLTPIDPPPLADLVQGFQITFIPLADAAVGNTIAIKTKEGTTFTATLAMKLKANLPYILVHNGTNFSAVGGGLDPLSSLLFNQADPNAPLDSYWHRGTASPTGSSRITYNGELVASIVRNAVWQ